MKYINNIKKLKSIISSNKSIFVRWSRGYNKDHNIGNSHDYLNGGTHEGLSSVEINPEWINDDVWLAKRITEYWFLKMKDNKIGCHIYTGKKVGEDSDGYDLIININHICTISTKLINRLLDIKKGGDKIETQDNTDR